MDKNFFLYNLSDKYYYENIEKRENSDEFYNIVRSLLPDEWVIKKSSIYFTCINKKQNIPFQGWKIHVSATLSNSKEILSIVTKILIERNISFKFMVDNEMLRISSQKMYPRASSGKFITIYPKNTDEFLKLLDILYYSLKDFKGPYILSDKRFKDCKILYYRYGGMIGQFIAQKDGNLIPVIYDENGSFVYDIRKPFFKIPINIENPVKDSPEYEEESHLRKNYKIKNSIYFSNSGGIYRAISICDNKEVIIKEARPYTCVIDDEKDSVYLREKEFKILKKLEKYNMTPKVIEIFKEWEHVFLVEEFIDGVTLENFCSANNPFYTTFMNNDNIDKYINSLITIFINMVEFLKIVHQNKLIISDLTPGNIMITKNLDVKFIDLEGCVKIDDIDTLRMHTIGFSEKSQNDKLIESDIYSLGCNFFSCLLRRNEMISIDKNVIEKFLNSLSRDYFLPNDLINIILELTQKSLEKRPNLDEVSLRLNNVKKLKSPCYKKDLKKNYNELNIKYSDLINKCILSIKSTANLERKDKLFPNTPIIDNPLNISYGALGNIFALNYLNQKNEVNEYMPWIKERLRKLNLYAPGLYVGLAGIAWVLLEIDESEIAKEVLKQCDKNPLFDNNFSIRCGLSGYGLTLIKFWLKTKNREFLDKAIFIGDKLILCGKIDNEKETAYWMEDKNYINIGYANGASGISLFLLYLYLATKEDKYLKIGECALKFDLSQKIKMEINDFYSFSSNNIKDKILYPYFMEGNAGILSVLIRYYKVTKNQYYLEEINKILPPMYIKYALNPGLFYGLAGLGNTLLDCYKFLEDPIYKDMAYDVAEGIDLYKILCPNGILFPGDYITKLSTDFGSGTSGIILFFNRLINDKENFCFFLDELIL